MHSVISQFKGEMAIIIARNVISTTMKVILFFFSLISYYFFHMNDISAQHAVLMNFLAITSEVDVENPLY